VLSALVQHESGQTSTSTAQCSRQSNGFANMVSLIAFLVTTSTWQVMQALFVHTKTNPKPPL
jgi:hypothetical protein